MGGEGLNLKAAFWRFAHWRYNSRKPSILPEIACFMWGGFWLFVYAAGFIADANYTLGYLPFGIAATALPLTIGLFHRHIRLETLKGSNALYLKWLDANR